MANEHRKRIVLIAGEASGDVLGASLIRELRTLYPSALFRGIGGPLMVAEGLDAWASSDELAVMGFAEVVSHLPRLLALRSRIRSQILSWSPDVVVGIDAPDFNLGVEKWLKQRGVRTVHYVSPSVWAWRENRASKIGESASRVLCLFPIEPPIYAKHGVDAVFVGHPLADEVPLEPSREAARASLGLSSSERVLALLPGSRRSEVDMLGATFLDAAQLLVDEMPSLRVVAPMASPRVREQFTALLSSRSAYLRDRVMLVDRQAQDVMVAADAILLASGTATLEAMLSKNPMVVAHRISPTTYRIVKGMGMLKTDVYSLPNFLAGGKVVPELMQDDCTPPNIASALRVVLQDRSTFDREVRPQFVQIHETLRQGAAASAARAIAEVIDAP